MNFFRCSKCPLRGRAREYSKTITGHENPAASNGGANVIGNGRRQREPQTKTGDPRAAHPVTHSQRRYAPSERIAVAGFVFAYSDSGGNLGDLRCLSFAAIAAARGAAFPASFSCGPTSAAGKVAAQGFAALWGIGSTLGSLRRPLFSGRIRMILLMAFAAAASQPSGPAVLEIRRATGFDFVQFSSFARCEAASRLLQAEDERIRELSEARGFHHIPGTEPIYRCIPG